MCLKCGSLIKAIDAYIAKADDDLVDALDEEGYIEPEETVDTISSIEEQVATALTEETDYILSEAEKAIDLEAFAESIWPGVKLNDVLKLKLLAIFKEQFGTLIPKLAGYYLASTDNGLEITRVSKRTIDWVENWSEELADIMQLDSHKQIESILKKGLEDGAGIAEFTRSIMDSGIRDEYYKARRVAVTEVLTAHRASAQEAYMQSPSVEEKMWRHTGSYRNQPRQNHMDMDGQRVRVNEPFQLTGIKGGTHSPMYPGDTVLPPEERINCHCISQPVVSDAVLGLPLEESQRLQQEAIDEMDDEWEKELDAKNRARAGIE